MGDLDAMTVDYINLELAVTDAPHSRRTPGRCAFIVVQVSEAISALSGAAVRSASLGQAGSELDSSDLLTIIAGFESLFYLKRWSY
jgi:hypothetical protein